MLGAWVLFAAAAVGVGFGAAGLVGDPFTEGATGSPAAARTPPASTSAPEASSPDLPTSSPASGKAPRRPGESPRGGGETSSPGAGGDATTRALSTRGGLVSGTCRGGLVSLNAAPAVGWAVDDLDDGPDEEARARFERVDDDDRVEVRASCAAGAPRFILRDDEADDDSGGD